MYTSAKHSVSKCLRNDKSVLVKKIRVCETIYEVIGIQVSEQSVSKCLKVEKTLVVKSIIMYQSVYECIHRMFKSVSECIRMIK